MSQAQSPSTGRKNWWARVLAVWGQPRSTYYARQQRARQAAALLRRGPKTKHTDAELLENIRAILAASPFHGEGHRKIWSGLRVQGVRTSKPCVMRLMRENQLLAPQRQFAPVVEKTHAGSIVTSEPNQMWGTDATTVTLADGQVTVFAAVDHCTAECVGIHAVKRATRFEAIEPLRQGVRERFGAFGSQAAAGLQIRHDHRSQYMSGHFERELRFLGMASSPVFVREPEANGCIERFFRTLKGQLLWVQHFQDLEDLQIALREFRDRYNRERLIERLAHQSPRQARERFLALQQAT
ncbi:MAG: integrase core domain-containing protein [Bryobacteraceae bacterium]|nr:integrase core domain-containing protein [Bryobacteraceae bacterium]